MASDVVSVERTISAPPSAIFALLADAAKHPLFDGSGAVKGVRSGGGEPLTMGSQFDMSMKLGLPYQTQNTVVEYEQDRRIAWQTTVTGPLGKVVGGRIWRYELMPRGEFTRVRETWDISKEPTRQVMRRIYPAKTRHDMARTLERLEQQATA